MESARSDYQIAARIERLPLSTWHLKILIPIGTGWFFDAFDALAIAYVLPVLIGLWKLTPPDIGALIAVGYFGQVIGSVFFGWLAERIGRVPCTLYTMVLFSVMSFACAFAWDLQSLEAMRFVQGIGLGGEFRSWRPTSASLPPRSAVAGLRWAISCCLRSGCCSRAWRVST